MAGKRLYILKTERENLVERLFNTKNEDKAKILVQIMDIDEDIAKLMSEEQKPMIRRFH